MAKDAYYFSHDSNARNDDKILKLRSGRNGAAKYGIYWMILELMRESSDISLPKDYKSLSWHLRCPCKLVQSVVEDYNLFTFSDTNLHFFSKRLQTSAILFQTKSQKAKQSALIKWEMERKAKLLASERNANAMQPQSDGNAIKVKEIKGNKSKVKETEITLLFNFLDFDEEKLNDSIIGRTQKLIDQFSYEKVQAAFLKVSELDEKKRNIAYIEALMIRNSTDQKISKNSNYETQMQYRDLTP